MGIKRSLLSRLSGRARSETPPRVLWRHAQWPARSIERFVVSFPKSGRTWLRALLGAAEAHRRGANVEVEVARWLAQEVPILAGGGVLFTHGLSDAPDEPDEHLDLFQRYVGGHRRLFLVRDPRDVVVSYYHQKVQREDRPAGVPGSLAEFVRHPRWGIDRICAFLVACRRGLREGSGPAMLLTYEELHADTAGSLARAVAFFGAADTSPEGLRAAVEYASFENLHRLEVASTPEIDPEARKTRKGRVGTHREELAAEDPRWVEARMAERLPREMGYGVGRAPSR